MSSRRASAHSAACPRPSRSEAPTSSPTPIAVLTARPVTEWRSEGSSRLASTNRAMCAGADGSVGQGELQRELSKASGTQMATIKKAAMAAKIAIRTAPSSGSTTLVSHV